MPAKNLHHDAVVTALKTDGWTITHDPFRLEYGKRDVFIDLAAERNVLGAERNGEKIAVEIQSVVTPSAVASLEQALGQYILYRSILS